MSINLQVNSFEFKSNGYISWLINFLGKQENSMLTEKTYEIVLKNGSNEDKKNLLIIEAFVNNLRDYACKNYININSYDANDYGYKTNFNVILKVQDVFLSFESVSSTYASYVFASILSSYNEDNYIEWELFQNDKSPKQIADLLSNLDKDLNSVKNQIHAIINSEYLSTTNLSYDEKKELVLNHIASVL